MIVQGYEIDITQNSVDVRVDDTTTGQSRSLFPPIAVTIFMIGLICFMLFLPGRDGTSTWNDLDYYRWPSGKFIAALLSLLGVTIFFGLLDLLAWRLLYFPTGVALHCDRSSFTVSKIPLTSLHGKWKDSSYPLDEISEFRFAITSRGKGSVFYGFSFIANGNQRRIFAGIQAPEAEDVLKGLKALGLDVVDDPDMQTMIEEAMQKRENATQDVR